MPQWVVISNMNLAWDAKNCASRGLKDEGPILELVIVGFHVRF